MATASAPTGKEINYDDSLLYKSVILQLHNVFTGASGWVFDKGFEIIAHRDHQDSLPISEIFWLRELLLWEQECKSLRSGFSDLLLTTGQFRKREMPSLECDLGGLRTKSN